MKLPLRLAMAFHITMFACVIIGFMIQGAIAESRKQILQSYLTPERLMYLSVRELTQIRVM